LVLLFALVGVAVTGFALFTVAIAMFHIGRLAGAATVGAAEGGGSTGAAPTSAGSTTEELGAGSVPDSNPLPSAGDDATLPPVFGRTRCAFCARARRFFAVGAER
jgi:hypothetical protein